jgi:hypothetical protein
MNKKPIESLRVEGFAAGQVDFLEVLNKNPVQKAAVDALLDKVVAIAKDPGKGAAFIIFGHSDRMARGSSTDAQRKTEYHRSQARATSASHYAGNYITPKVDVWNGAVAMPHHGWGADSLKYEHAPDPRNRAVTLTLIAFECDAVSGRSKPSAEESEPMHEELFG